jgi:hypothetical protein
MDIPTTQLHIGQLTIGSKKKEALVHYNYAYPFLFFHDTESQKLTSDLCEGSLLQILKHLQAGQGKVLMYEASPSNHFSQLKRVFIETSQQWGKQFFNAKECIEKLGELNELAHKRFSMIATAHTDNIFTFNTVSHQPESLIFLLLTGIDKISHDLHYLQTLDNLCKQGAKVGIFPILIQNYNFVFNEEKTDHKYKAIQSFFTRNNSYLMFHIDNNKVKKTKNQPEELWRLFQKFNIKLGISLSLRKQWADALLKASQDSEEENPYSDFLQIPIGKEGAAQAYFSMGTRSDCYHALIGGATRTGKTTFINNLIISSCEKFSPAEIRFALFDFKEGVSFHVYEGLEHIDILHVDNEDKQHILDSFAAYLEAFKQRKQLFRQYSGVQSLAEYNKVADKPLPYWIMVVDEAQSLFEERETKKVARELLKTVSRKGAAFGLHLILSTQSYQNVELEKAEKDQFRLRIAFQHASAMGCNALFEGYDNHVPLNLPRYSVVYNGNNGQRKDNHIVVLDNLSREEFINRLNNLKKKHPKQQKVIKPKHLIKQATTDMPSNNEWDDWDTTLG